MAPGCRPLYEDRNARISILANGVAERPDTFVQTVRASITKPLADGAGHTFAPAAERRALTWVASIICICICVDLPRAATAYGPGDIAAHRGTWASAATRAGVTRFLVHAFKCNRREEHVRMRGKWPDRPPRLPSRFPTWRHRSALRLCLVARPKKSNNLCTLAARGIQ